MVLLKKIPLLILLLFLFSLNLGAQEENSEPVGLRHFYNQSDNLPHHQLRISVVGDIMFHHTQLYRGWREESQDFDFSHAFEYVKSYLSDADISIGNLETTLAGPGGALMYVPETHYKGYQAYPTFNSPSVIASNLKDAGFDIIQTSNNHSMDSGLSGVDQTLRELHKRNLLTVGTSTRDLDDPLYIYQNGISLSITNWSYGTNGISIPSEGINRVNSLMNYSEERIEMMLRQITQGKEMGVDWVVATIHFGPEYQTEPHKVLQESLVDRMIEAGADIILGSHPHVLQPMEIRYRRNGNGTEEPVFIIYSLGNFLASQPWRSHRPYETDNSIILTLELEKNFKGINRLSAVEFIPVYTQWNQHAIRVVPVEWALTEEGKAVLGYSSEDQSRLPYIQTYVPEHITKRLEGIQLQKQGNSYRFEVPAGITP